MSYMPLATGTTGGQAARTSQHGWRASGAARRSARCERIPAPLHNAILRQLSSSEAASAKKKKHKKSTNTKTQEGKKIQEGEERRRDDDDAPVVAANIPVEKLDAEDDYYARARSSAPGSETQGPLLRSRPTRRAALRAPELERGRLDASYHGGGRPRRRARATVVVQALRHGRRRARAEGRRISPSAGPPVADPSIRQTTRGRGGAVPAAGSLGTTVPSRR